MTSIALPSGFAAAAYQAVIAGQDHTLPADRDRPAALEDRGSLLDMLLTPHHAAILRPAVARSLLAGIPTRQARPLTAASA